MPVREDDDNGEVVGTLYIRANTDNIAAHTAAQIRYIVLVSLGSLLIAVTITAFLQNAISRPILRLTEAAQVITREENYSIRVTRESQDELGTLYRSFNQMLDALEIDARRSGDPGRAAGEGSRRAQAGRGRSARGQGSGRGEQPGEERVPGQHEPRDSHAAHRHPRLHRRAAGRRRRRRHGQADRVSHDDPGQRQASADGDQRHSGPVEDRVGPRRVRARGLHAGPARRGSAARAAGEGRREVAGAHGPLGDADSADDLHRCDARAAGADQLVGNSIKFTAHGLGRSRRAADPVSRAGRRSSST